MSKRLWLAPAAALAASFGLVSVAVAEPMIDLQQGSVSIGSLDATKIKESPKAAEPNPIESVTSLSDSTPVKPASGMQRVMSVSELSASEAKKPVTPGMSQVTSVSQLSDVRPTDWAFQALQSLVERYGCIAGYPDRTYRGNRALTRFEFAAGLNACLDRVNELIAASTADLIKKEDLTALQKLQEEFAAELATLRGRVDTLEARATTLERQQFSTTTKLTGNVWFNLTGAFPSGDITTERSLAAGGSSAFIPPTRVGGVPTRVARTRTPSVTFSYYTFLNLTTSFTGRDQLVTQLVSGNGNSPANELVSSGFFNSWGVPITDQTGVVTTGSLAVRELFYSFPLNDSVRVAFGPRLNFYRYFDQNRFTFFLTGASSFNSSGSTLVNAVDRGSGAVVIWNITPQFRLTGAYLAENTEFLNPAAGFNTSSNPSRGLFRSTNTISAELAYSPSSAFNFRFLYTRSNLFPYNGFIGGGVGEPVPYGYLDDGFGGRLRDSTADAIVANFDWLITPKFGVFGRYSYGRTEINPVSPIRAEGSVRVQSFQFGLGFPDLGKKGALGVLSFLVPHQYLSGRQFLLSGNGDGGTQYELEASYFYPVNRNLAIVPSFYAIFNPNNFDSNPTVFVGNVRTQFSF
ncbi:S-layer protein, putative [Leptolyngbya sp. NIES-2104]|uniref:iron uptake porin n=2 Tax=Leptolyngbya sp. NIES-2104 TaxID=1552121 RepID=UPI0006ECB39B|nr:iron uptake porin [Leptolyngbya sp. NIES-2104]GAP94531.1 S-layer protein, putative [Leptolyngbya sp. NIES-2104]